MTRIEHANITVPDIDAAIEFFKIVAPEFYVRKDEKPSDSYRWAHIGNEDYYFALQEPHLNSDSKRQLQAYENFGINHIGLIVTNIRDIEANLIAGGYRRGIDTPVEKHRKRIYYFDHAGFEWELVEYLSDEPGERYLYE